MMHRRLARRPWVGFIILAFISTSLAQFPGAGDEHLGDHEGAGWPEGDGYREEDLAGSGNAQFCAVFGKASSALKNSRIHAWTPNARYNEFHQKEGLLLIRHFGVRPLGGFMDGYNAFATRDHIWGKEQSLRGPDGTIIYGLPLMLDQFRRDPSGVTVRAVHAHEFAHILQIKRGMRASKWMELHADYLSGWYLSRVTDLRGGKTESVLDQFFRMGSTNLTNPTHGAPRERVSAVAAGMRDGSASVGTAYANGEAFVRSMRMKR